MEVDLSPEVMLAFYRRLYPFKSIFTWLNHEHTPTKQFSNREFAFTLAGDIYLRYQSFVTFDEMKKQVCQMNPTRFEIGPVYSARVSPISFCIIVSGRIVTMRCNIAERQKDCSTGGVPAYTTRARVRYRYDRLRPHPNLLL
jgi:hypothetical protein